MDPLEKLKQQHQIKKEDETFGTGSNITIATHWRFCLLTWSLIYFCLISLPSDNLTGVKVEKQEDTMDILGGAAKQKEKYIFHMQLF